MARTAVETASILRDLYDEEFNGDESEPYRLGWDQLRGIAGVERVTGGVIAGISKMMLNSGYVLVPLDNYLLVGMEANYRHTRKVPARLVENYLAVTGDDLVDDDEDQAVSDADDSE